MAEPQAIGRGVTPPRLLLLPLVGANLPPINGEQKRRISLHLYALTVIYTLSK